MVTLFEFDRAKASLRRAGGAASLSEASAQLPAGAYTTLRTYQGDRVLRLDRHVERLLQSARELALAPATLGLAELRRAIAGALEATGHSESRLRLTWVPPQLFVAVEPFAPPPAALYDAGVWCVSVALRRAQPHAKDSRFLAPSAGVYTRLAPGAHEALLLGEDGALLEGLSSNFFAVRDGALRTEESRVLYGVTRSLVLEIAAELVPVTSTAVRLEELASVSEAFITSVSRGVVPVVRIDERVLGDGRPGPLTREIRRRFDERVAREAVSVFD